MRHCLGIHTFHQPQVQTVLYVSKFPINISHFSQPQLATNVFVQFDNELKVPAGPFIAKASLI